MLPEIHHEQLTEAIEQIVRETLAFADVVGPPIDAFVVAQRLGLTILRDNSAASRARMVEVGPAATLSRDGSSQGVILLADDPRPERRQWAVAHEIGEHLAVEVFEQLAADPADALPAARESLANRLATSLLLPLQWYRHDGSAHDWELLELKKLYYTASHELIARRMLDMSAAVMISVFDQGELTWRRGNRVGVPCELLRAEVEAQAMCHNRGKTIRVESSCLPDELESVRAWPVFEDSWRRVIIRTELNWLE
ncbi:ImmA/IrrE family metallo-endopeptidase [Adhaeretor mobilis]|uniref:Uncharacterized protein n=1 Tax=Adhaeretor mobilis TaxID=1930276 RepID=A0A517MUR4_9BACT|nr:ImmA/IrrE family metallo-endopeptidase [Adhaeretor mobilis]QDS98621.1 hypothetical protein HG15A2_19020 [Adhaeretor mobilis]